MDPWVGPAIIAAVVSGVVSAAGWFVTSWQQLRLERQRRAEKVNDFQVALRAEIESDLLQMEGADNAALLAAVRQSYRDSPAYRPFVPHLAANVVFDSLVEEIHVLPGEVIEPIIRYSRQRQVLARFIEDLRNAVNSAVPADRALLMFEDYFDMLDRLELLAGNAVAALDISLNTPGAGQPARWSASAPGEGPASAGSERLNSP